MFCEERLALVVPTLNEAECLPRMLEETRRVLDRLQIAYEILVVDDDSRDRTREIVTSIAAKDARVRLLVRCGERGLAGAVLHGWQHTGATLLGVMDADLQHPPALLLELLEEMARGHDVALASRYARGGAVRGWNPVRRMISAAAICMTFPLQRRAVRVKDPMSGYFVVRRRCIENLAWRPGGFKLLLEILVRGRIGSVKEVPFAFGRRSAGRSKARLGVAWDYLRLLATLYRWRLKEPVTEGVPVSMGR